MNATVTCRRCGSKVAAARDRCPRCRAALPKPGAAPHARHGRRLAMTAAAIMGVFLVGCTSLYLAQPAPVSHVTTVSAFDPFASRRQAAESPEEVAPDDAGAPPAAVQASPVESAVEPAEEGTAPAADDGEIAHLQDALAREPDDAETLMELGQALVHAERMDDALLHMTRAVELHPDRWTFRFKLGRAYALLGRWSDAIEEYQYAERLQPGDATTAFNLGMVLYQRGDDASSIEAYTRAIALAPANASYRLAVATSYERLRDTARAAAAYGEYLRLAPNDPDAERVRTRLAQLNEL